MFGGVAITIQILFYFILFFCRDSQLSLTGGAEYCLKVCLLQYVYCANLHIFQVTEVSLLFEVAQTALWLNASVVTLSTASVREILLPSERHFLCRLPRPLRSTSMKYSMARV